jgi:hypothetical protein
MSKQIAILTTDNQVETIWNVADDWTPPVHLRTCPVEDLPPGWQRVPVPTPEVTEITPRQMRLAMLQSGIDPDGIRAMLDQIPDAATRKQAVIEWEYALAIRRDHPMLEPLAAMCGISHEQLDALFRLAATF